MRTTSRNLLAAATAGALLLPALPVVATQTGADAAGEHDRLLALRARAAVALDHLDPADAALLRRALRARDVLARLGDGFAPTVSDLATSDRAADQPVTDRSVTDRPATDLPTTDRPDTDRPDTDRPAHREQTFPVGDIGAVTLAWNQHGIRIVNVRTAEGWHSRIITHEPRRVEIDFTNGESGALFWAQLTPDGLRHGVERRPVDDRPDVHTYEVLDAGQVAIALTDHGMRLVGVREAEGWVSRHDAEPRRIHVVFLNREERRRVDFVAELTRDGEIVTHIEETVVTETDATTRPTDPALRDQDTVR
jgi:hypothetical protein